jgi:iron complex outermembrane receptor protein
MVLLKARNMATDSDPSIPLFFDNNGNNIFDEGDVPYDDRFVTAGTYMNYSNYHDAGISTPDITQQPPEINNVDVFRPSDIEKINHLDSKDFTLSFDWQITDNVSLKSITAYREYENIFGDDSDGSPIAIQQLLQEMEHEQFTQELRLNSTLFDGYADTTIGVFYLDQETIETAQVNINYAPLDFIHGPDKVPSTSKAVYGQGTLHVNERTDVTLGARYSEDEKKYSFRRRNPDGTEIEPIAGNPFAPDSPPNQLLFATNGASTPTYSSDRFDFRIAIDYDIIEKTLVYAQIATGYRAGGNNARPYYPEQINTYDPEKLINYEAGIKSTIADQLRLNASIFFNDYTDIQLPLNACYWMPEGQKYPCASQDNIGDGEVKGLEIEGIWRPTKAFSMDFTYSYIDFEYTKIKTYEGAPLSEAKRTPYTPETTWSLGAQYRFDIGKFGDLTTRVDASFQDEMDGFSFVGLGAKIPDYTVFNSRVTWRSEDLKWQASFECTNLFDKYYYLSNFDLSDGRSIFTNAQPGRPREYALTIKRVWYFK